MKYIIIGTIMIAAISIIAAIIYCCFHKDKKIAKLELQSVVEFVNIDKQVKISNDKKLDTESGGSLNSNRSTM